MTTPTLTEAGAPAAAFTLPPAYALTAAQSDPNLLGWMQGHPPPIDKRVQQSDGSFFTFPKTRWAFSNTREIVPTSNIPRGTGAVSTLPTALRDDLDDVACTVLGSSPDAKRMTWDEAFNANYTDGIVVLHKGQVVYERYAGALTPNKQHWAFSVTKSFVGTLGAMRVFDGSLDANKLIPHYIPELKDSAFGTATVRQVMDMTTNLQYLENYADPKAEIWEHSRAGGLLPKPIDYTGEPSFYDYLPRVKLGAEYDGQHGQGFRYKTVNTDVLGWILRRIAGEGKGEPKGERLGEQLSKQIWSRLGCEQDAYITVDSAGTEFAGGGLHTSLRDLARFGEMMRQGGFYNGQQIVPEAVVAGICQGAGIAHFASAGYNLLPGWSYQSMWWITHNEHGAYMARGIHGQAIYIDPKAEMVIARYGSHPLAANAHLDPTSLPAYHALAKHLIANG